MGYPLHGQDLSPTITPVQARLGWAVGWGKESFFGDRRCARRSRPGRPALLRGLLATGRGIPRPGMVVRDPDGRRGRRGHLGHVLPDTEDRESRSR